MSLFLVTKKGQPKETFGVYKVLVTEGPNIHFLIWNENKWKIVEAEEYIPEEYDNIFNTAREE